MLFRFADAPSHAPQLLTRSAALFDREANDNCFKETYVDHVGIKSRFYTSARPPPSKTRRVLRSPKASRSSTSPRTASKSLTAASNASTQVQILSIHLRPCHICHRRPHLKKELGSYTDCMSCGKRMCYICMRRCDLGGCGGQIVCSNCCVEVGEEGDGCCVDCVSANQR
jgi:hypothetical protein